MPNFNKVFLMGHLTRDVEMRYTQSGTAVGALGMAVNRKWKDKEETLFIDLTAWGKQAETLAEYVGKGSPLFIEGRLQLDSWEAQDGQKRNKIKVVIEQFQFVGGKGKSAETPKRRDDDPPHDEDDIPF